jgi:hypothetical protein
MSTGRKELYPSESYYDVVRLIGEGIPLADALGGKGRPGRTAFYQRLKEDGELEKAYALAMQQRAAGRADKLLEINELLMKGKIDPQSAKVASDNYKWLASKEDSRRYGDISRQEITGRDGANLIPEQQKMSDMETARLLAYLWHKGTKGVEDRGDLVALESAP